MLNRGAASLNWETLPRVMAKFAMQSQKTYSSLTNN